MRDRLEEPTCANEREPFVFFGPHSIAFCNVFSNHSELNRTVTKFGRERKIPPREELRQWKYRRKKIEGRPNISCDLMEREAGVGEGRLHLEAGEHLEEVFLSHFLTI